MQNAEPTTPLYIRARHLEYIALRGPALEISVLNQSPQRFPLRRLRHVTLLGQTQVDLSALLLAASKGVPVAWFDGRGHMLCQVLPKLNAEKQLAFLIEPVMYCSNAQQKLKQLTENFTRHACSQVARELGFSTTRLNELKDMIARINRERGKGVQKTAAEWFEGIWHQHWQQLLHKNGVRPNSQLAEALTPEAKRITWAWRVRFLFNLLLRHREVASAETVARTYRVIEEPIELLLQRFLIGLADEIGKPEPWLT